MRVDILWQVSISKAFVGFIILWLVSISKAFFRVAAELCKAAQLCVFILGSGTLALVYLGMCLGLGMR